MDGPAIKMIGTSGSDSWSLLGKSEQGGSAWFERCFGAVWGGRPGGTGVRDMLV